MKANNRFTLNACAAVPLILILLMQCRLSDNPGAASDPTDLLPADNDISGFLRKGGAAVMTDQQSIYNAIDGQAEVYIDYGFAEGVKQLYSNGTVDIDVQIFNQGSEENALGLFDRFYPPSPELISRKNPEVVIDHSLSTGYQIQYARESILMRISTTEKSDFALNMAKQFYRNIDGKIGNE